MVPEVVPKVVPVVVVPVVVVPVVVVPVVAPMVVVPVVVVPVVVPSVVLPEVEPLVELAFSEVVQALKRVSDAQSRAPVNPKSHLRFIALGKSEREKT